MTPPRGSYAAAESPASEYEERKQTLARAARRFRIVAFGVLAVAVVTLLASLAVPFVRTRLPGLETAWWWLAAVAGFVLLVEAYSLARFFSAGRHVPEPPLERPEPPDLDYDAPWRGEDDA